jgi:hypothetical protein
LADAAAAGHGRTLKTDLPATLIILALIFAWLGRAMPYCRLQQVPLSLSAFQSIVCESVLIYRRRRGQ